MRRIVGLSVLAVSLAGCTHAPPTSTATATATGAAAPAQPSATASSKAVTTAPTAGTVNPEAVQALRSMGSYLQTLGKFEVTVDLTGERVLEDGQKLTHMASATVAAQRPNQLRARMRSVRSERELIYDGKTVVLYMPAQRYYSRAAFSGNLADLAGRLQERYGIELPMADLFLWGTPQAPLDGMTSAMNAGQDIVDDEVCDHYAFRQGDIDWQIWIAAGPRKLPRKLVITNRADEARPQSVSLIRWNLNPRFRESFFTFAPPKEARVAEFVPMKTQ
ncbi:DUF2092 domain-containing protein [Cupriavidus respiraculi]|uniref:DUF2092 domain-containing protein n=1 Tax=Cupriavidus respiraculi TaxID=195930 RepID=A0ABM8XH68_9BURK|nr:DUF2092 domain-containing protein [Cupriavidus respiraculi]CAG9179527.1 hypothetical protein LMG21510_03804 [Cupriavidus respiraculi]